MGRVIFTEMSSACRSSLDFNVGSGKLLTILNIITHYCVSIRRNASAATCHRTEIPRNNMLQSHLFITTPTRFDLQHTDKINSMGHYIINKFK